MFIFNNIHGTASNERFLFNFSTDGGSNYNVVKTTTRFGAIHSENDPNVYGLNYEDWNDLAQSTAYQLLSNGVGNDNDQSTSGYLHLFNPSSTTYVKHFISNVNNNTSDDYTLNTFCAGYGNTTNAVDAIQFKMSSGNIDDGIIKMYGVAKS